MEISGEANKKEVDAQMISYGTGNIFWTVGFSGFGNVPVWFGINFNTKLGNLKVLKNGVTALFSVLGNYGFSGFSAGSIPYFYGIGSVEADI